MGTAEQVDHGDAEVLAEKIPERHVASRTCRRRGRELALEKAQAVASRFPEESCVLAADTLVVVDEDVLGKPRDPNEAVEMMLRIQGRTHRVLTGFAFVVRALGVVESDVVESVVRMHAVDRDTARAYARSGEPLDKAGA